MTKYVVVQYADGLTLTLDRQGYSQGYYIGRTSLFQSLGLAFKKVTQRDRYCRAPTSIAEAAKGIKKAVTQRDHYCGFDSIAEAAKGIIGAGDYIIAIDDGVSRPLNRKERREFDRLRK